MFIGGPSNKTVHLMTVRSNAVSWRNRTLKCPLTLILSFYEETKKKQTERLEMKKKKLKACVHFDRSFKTSCDRFVFLLQRAFLSTLSSMHVGR